MPAGVGTLTGTAAPTSGVLQVETATVVGTITLAGNATVVVTAAGMTGSPITVQVAVALNDTATQVADKIRAALTAHATIGAFFTFSGATAAIVCTAKVSLANDATMNFSVDNGTCTGLTTAATSASTTAGVRGDWHGVSNQHAFIDTTGKTVYINTGDEKCPIWTLM